MNKIMLPVTLRGKFKLEAIRPDGSKRLLADWFDNLILDLGMNRIGTGATIEGAAVGTGTTAPAVSQTQLVSHVAYTTNRISRTFSNMSASPWTSTTTFKYRFAKGAAEGNLTEVGMGWSSTTLFSRELIRDGNGDPTTITVLADEILDVTYVLELNPPLADTTTSITLDGVTYNVTIRPIDVTNINRWRFPGDNSLDYGNSPFQGDTLFVGDGVLKAINAQWIDNRLETQDKSTQSYTQDSFKKIGTFVWGVNQGNVAGGITTCQWGPYYTNSGLVAMFQCEFDAAIPKDNTKELTLNLGLSWARAA